MQFELYIGDEKKMFSVPFVPMLAKRKYLEINAEAEGRKEIPTAKEQIAEDDDMISILTDVVFKGQFTIQQVYEGASNEYVYSKLNEAIYGKKIDGEQEGNDQGE